MRQIPPITNSSGYFGALCTTFRAEMGISSALVRILAAVMSCPIVGHSFVLVEPDTHTQPSKIVPKHPVRLRMGVGCIGLILD